MALLAASSKTKFRRLIKAELIKVKGKTIESVTWRECDMTIHFTDHTHLRLASDVSIEAVLKP